MPEFPREFTVETAPQPTRYVLADDFCVVSSASVAEGNVDVEFELEEEGLAVCRRRQVETSLTQSKNARPVYRLGEHGPLAVPGGLVFVRFDEQASLEDHRNEIKRAGFEISRILPYAPHAGWVEPSSGEIVDAICRFKALKRIPGVETVEPQMLMERQRR